eukprot:c20408_g1_i1.p1 GENE.c20408_g1_i1~~c20408_g1_i1.p1  ORF type:complete len:407 (+),score=-22.73 c20408_g1_i1:36-1256(+)
MIILYLVITGATSQAAAIVQTIINKFSRETKNLKAMEFLNSSSTQGKDCDNEEIERDIKIRMENELQLIITNSNKERKMMSALHSRSLARKPQRIQLKREQQYSHIALHQELENNTDDYTITLHLIIQICIVIIQLQRMDSLRDKKIAVMMIYHLMTAYGTGYCVRFLSLQFPRLKGLLFFIGIGAQIYEAKEGHPLMPHLLPSYFNMCQSLALSICTQALKYLDTNSTSASNSALYLMKTSTNTPPIVLWDLSALISRFGIIIILQSSKTICDSPHPILQTTRRLISDSYLMQNLRHHLSTGFGYAPVSFNSLPSFDLVPDTKLDSIDACDPFTCPVSKCVLQDPVVALGHLYSRSSVDQMLKNGEDIYHQRLTESDIQSAPANVKNIISEYITLKQKKGIDEKN